MSNLFTERVLNMAAVTPQPEDYTGEDGLLLIITVRLSDMKLLCQLSRNG